MKNVYLCDAIRTPVGKYGGSLSTIRTDDLATVPVKSLMERNPGIDWSQVDDVALGCANQAGEDNRNVARMALLLAGIPDSVPGVTINRLCGSGMEAVGAAARTIRTGEADLIVAGGVESMSRSPYVMQKPAKAFDKKPEIYDSTLGWRFVNKKMDAVYGTDPLMVTAQNIADEKHISREDQDRFAHWSQWKTNKAQKEGLLAKEIVPVTVPQRKADPLVVDTDEHPRFSSLEKLASLKVLTGENGTLTAGNSSGINDGAAALLIASEEAVEKFQLTPKAKILGTKAAGVPPRIMGMGPVPATQRLMKHLGMSLDQMDIIELNEAFAAQSLGCTREMGLADDDPRVNPLGGAIALGHPLGMSGARLVTTAMHQLQRQEAQYALTTMCIGVGQGISMVLEKV